MRIKINDQNDIYCKKLLTTDSTRRIHAQYIVCPITPYLSKKLLYY